MIKKLLDWLSGRSRQAELDRIADARLAEARARRQFPTHYDKWFPVLIYGPGEGEVRFELAAGFDWLEGAEHYDKDEAIRIGYEKVHKAKLRLKQEANDHGWTDTSGE